MARNILITGAGRGIGYTCARLFATRGERVFVNYVSCRTQRSIEELRLNQMMIPIRADITKSEDVSAMADFIHKNYGGIDVLINNAGISQQKMFCDITEADWDRMFDVNIKGMFLVTKAFLPDMITRKKGRIINMSSMWGIAGGSCEVHYSASKGAVISFTKALARECGLSGIRVNCIAPGVIDTDMNKCHSKETMDQLACETSVGRLGMANEVAETAWFLASDASDYINAQVIQVDGGIL